MPTSFWRSRTTWAGLFGVAVAVAGAWEAIEQGMRPGLALAIAAGAAARYLQTMFLRDATVTSNEQVAEAVREASGVKDDERK